MRYFLLYASCLVVVLGHASDEAKKYPLLSNRAAIAVLIESLKSEDFDTRHRAVEFIGGRGAEAKVAVPSLIELMEGDVMADSAARALGRIGPKAEAAIPTLIKGLEKRKTRWNSIHALARIGDASIPSLEASLQHERVAVRFASHTALALLRGKDTEHFQFLLDGLLSESPATVESAVRGLNAVGPLPQTVLPNLLEALESPAVDAYSLRELISIIAVMEGNAAAAVPKIIEYLEHSHRMTRLRALQAIDTMGGEQFASAVPVLIEILGDEQEFFRESAADALGAIGPKASSAVPYLIEQVKAVNPSMKRAQTRAVQALLEINSSDPEVISALVDQIRGPDKQFAYTVSRLVAHESTAPEKWLLHYNLLYEEGLIIEETLRVLELRSNPGNQSVFEEGRLIFDNG
ncbi:hypothetical protein DDZ13_05420 [Coraliomargarita sinensis]|uniref:HEAT repeat domain-containing protein n=1 Tax=Coraliomargarita sinensis TaxID=2174842 RepID=A0A317ZK53_9BACT|nr:HEAT repeat domain-containing protein [Coraliomargarita sinensis]PXA04613.1 hypothetical protein DDZ13_05420 [Coraliomargarita sinensis]